MKLADLTRDIRINIFLELVVFSKLGLSEFHNSSAEKNMYLDPDVFFAKPGLPEFHKSTAEKKHIFLDHVFFQSRACLSFITAVRIKPFFRA